jgi:S1-C subfamily serine protease
MKRISTLLLVYFAALGLAAAPAANLSEKAGSAPAQNLESSVVRVNSTNQDYDFFRPWSKKSPRAIHGLGAVLAGNRVLVTAQLIANHSYVELERAETGSRTPAKVLCVDYEANLALLQPSSANFLTGLKPLELALDAVVGDRLDILQLEANDALITTPGPITTVEVSHYQLENTEFLLYRLSVPLQYREGSFTAPAIKDGKLAGLLMRYDPRTQELDVLPAPVIEHFLKDVDGGAYHGFPRAGMEYVPTRDPQLRHYAKLPAGGGVYLTDVARDSPAGLAGLQPGDVVWDVDGHAVDQDGDYQEPLYGRISLSYLITTHSFVGQKMHVKIFRDGQPLTLEITLAHEAPGDYVSEPYVIDRQPRYVIVNGLIFQDLSRQYLKEWGGDWQKQAPQRLVYLDRYQSSLVPENRKRIVILSQVLPVASNVGYEEMKYLVVTNVNGVPINSLDDLPGALAKSADGFTKIEFEDFPKEIFIDNTHLADNDKNVQESYSLPALQQLK